MRIGSRVRHLTDPHGRNEGVVVDRGPTWGRLAGVGLVKVRWSSGVVETIHPSELRPIDSKEVNDG